jgi:hypothetical protein
MSKGTSNKPYIKPMPYTLINKTFVSNRKISDELINTTFLMFIEGDLLKIEEHLRNNNISSLNFKNDDNKSVLHVILGNTNSSKDDKYKLVEFALKKNAPVDMADNNGITPLHIASEGQYQKIVKILCEYGANVRLKDAQGQIALHYAVNGKKVKCPTIDENKVKPIVPVKKEASKIDIFMNDIQKSIINILNNTSDINFIRYIDHLRYLAQSVYYSEKIEMDKKRTDILKSINEIITNKTLTKNQKESQIENRLNTERLSIINILEKSLADGILPLTIAENTKNGWGPAIGTNNLIINQILPYNDHNKIVKDIQNEASNKKFQIKTSLESLNTELSQYEKKFINHNLRIQKVIGYVKLFNYVLENNVFEAPILNNIIDILFSELSDGIDHIIFEENGKYLFNTIGKYTPINAIVNKQRLRTTKIHD